MARNPNRKYRNSVGQKYTRKEYIRKYPLTKKYVFQMGDLAPLKETNRFYVISQEKKQIRERQIESTRVVINKKLTKMLTRKGFNFKIIPFPHHILRENKFATGAGADRSSEGMRRSFGKAIEKSIRVKSGTKIFKIGTIETNIEKVKQHIRSIFPKIGAKIKLIYQKVF